MRRRRRHRYIYDSVAFIAVPQPTSVALFLRSLSRERECESQKEFNFEMLLTFVYSEVPASGRKTLICARVCVTALPLLFNFNAVYVCVNASRRFLTLFCNL